MLFFFAVKKRLVKLVVNFLFYFRTDEAEVWNLLLLLLLFFLPPSLFCFCELIVWAL